MPLATRALRMPGSLRALRSNSIERTMVGAEQLADRRMDARQAFALRLDLRAGAAHLVHVRGRSADVADDAG